MSLTPGLDKKYKFELSKVDLQNKNLFKLLLIENFRPDSGTSGFAGNALNAGLDIANQAASIAITKYLQSVSFTSPRTMEYEHSNVNFVKVFKRPENVTLSFLEDDKGSTWRFLNNWMNEVVATKPVSWGDFGLELIGQSDAPIEYMFKDNQARARKTGIFLPGTGRPKVQKYPRIVFQNMMPISIGDQSYDAKEGGNVFIEAQFSVSAISTPIVI